MSFLVPTFADAVEDLSMPAVAAPVVLWNGGVARREATVLSNILRVLLFAGESENEETDIPAHLAYYLLVSRKRVITKLIDAFSLCSISQCRLFNVARNTSACLSRPSLCSLSIHFPYFFSLWAQETVSAPRHTIAPCPPSSFGPADGFSATRETRASAGVGCASGMHAPGRTRNDVLSRPAARQTEFADSPRQQQQQQEHAGGSLLLVVLL